MTGRWTAVLDSNSASPATAGSGTIGVRVDSTRNSGKRKQKRTCWALETGTHWNWNVQYISGERWIGSDVGPFQLGEFHLSAGLESDSQENLIFRQSGRTRGGITTRVGVSGRLKAKLLPCPRPDSPDNFHLILVCELLNVFFLNDKRRLISLTSFHFVSDKGVDWQWDGEWRNSLEARWTQYKPAYYISERALVRKDLQNQQVSPTEFE